MKLGHLQMCQRSISGPSPPASILNHHPKRIGKTIQIRNIFRNETGKRIHRQYRCRCYCQYGYKYTTCCIAQTAHSQQFEQEKGKIESKIGQESEVSYCNRLLTRHQKADTLLIIALDANTRHKILRSSLHHCSVYFQSNIASNEIYPIYILESQVWRVEKEFNQRSVFKQNK